MRQRGTYLGKARSPVCLEERPHLPDRGLDFTRTNAAALAQPCLETDRRSLRRLARFPGQDAPFGRQFACCRHDTEPARDGSHLSIRSGGQVVADELLPQSLHKLVEGVGIVRACRYQLARNARPAVP